MITLGVDRVGYSFRTFDSMIHKKLNVYIKIKSLILLVYNITSTLPSIEKYNLGSQMCRSSLSIISNLSEGLVKSSPKDKLRFIEMAYASLSELDTQIEICFELHYINLEIFKELEEKCIEIAKMLSGLRKRIKSTQ